MRLALITTHRTNIGDDFVREGILAAFDTLYSYEPYLINKHFPEETCLGFLPGDYAPSKGDKILSADVVVQCGAPVYWNLGPYPGQRCWNAEWVVPLWYDRIAKVFDRTPILNLAAGACQSYFGSASDIVNDHDCRQFIRDIHQYCRLTTVRDPLAAEVASALDLAVKQEPCTAAFAWRRWHASPDPANDTVAVNYMPLAGHYDLDGLQDPARWRATFLDIVRKLESRGCNVVPIAHDAAEREEMSLLLPEYEIMYSEEATDYYAFYARCAGGIVNRVHGAILLAGAGSYAVLIANDSRSQSLDLFGLPRVYVGDVNVKEIVDRCVAGMADLTGRRRLQDLESAAFERLCALIASAIGAVIPDRAPIS